MGTAFAGTKSLFRVYSWTMWTGGYTAATAQSFVRISDKAIYFDFVQQDFLFHCGLHLFFWSTKDNLPLIQIQLFSSSPLLSLVSKVIVPTVQSPMILVQ